MTPAIPFFRTFATDLRSGAKQQTTRKQTDRFAVGDVVHITIVPRERCGAHPAFCAHSLGKVVITDIYDVLPINSCGKEGWAKLDGFDNFAAADKWFEDKYGEDWMCQYWTVIRWDGWLERYFEVKR